MKNFEYGVTFAKGFSANGDYVGIKKKRKDLAVIVSEIPAVAAGCFTTNIVKAAPVLWDEMIINNKNKVNAIVVNSGNANACTGEVGINDNEKMAITASNLLNCNKENVLICSTGVIGVNLPIDTIINGIPAVIDGLGSTSNHDLLASEAIMTTDTFTKRAAVEYEYNGIKIRIGGMAKGSGMIHPNMATMLSFVTTDCNISQKMLQKALYESTLDSYNMISVDGDSSTNDTSLILANGLAQNVEITEETEGYEMFKNALHQVNKTLAISIAKDGEGATKLMSVIVTGARTKEDARKISRSVVSSNLFKAALFGSDANWGRVLCAMGYSGGEFIPDLVNINFSSCDENGLYKDIDLMTMGKPIVFDESLAKEILSENSIEIYIELNDGENTATSWGCDLSYDYVKINGDYRS